MLLFRDLSFRYKIPLRAVVLVAVTAMTLTAANVTREYEQMRSDLFDNAETLGRVLAMTLITPMLHDDLWRAYELISMPVSADTPASLGAETMLVIDARGRIYASTRPRVHPVQTPLNSLGAVYARLAVEIEEAGQTSSRAVDLPDADDFYLLMPVMFDGVRLGTLVMVYPKSIFIPRFHSIVSRAALMTLLVLSLLLPMSWYWGRRMATPLVQLADCMGKVGERIPDESEYTLYESRDEIGRAGAQLKNMLRALREKQALEQQVIASERLAAIGRITAGIAHEINNPLGGMLNAISTYKKHGQAGQLETRTLPLLERGLLQIKDTVGALLVESRLQSHPLAPQDLDDVQTLLLPHLARKRVQLIWHGMLLAPVALPSTQVRQILLNLLLNAIQAAEPDSEIGCEIAREPDCLLIRVANRGQPIPAERLNHLFEPFVGTTADGHGLGLWVTYQLVQQLNGRIAVDSDERIGTVFSITLPVTESV